MSDDGEHWTFEDINIDNWVEPPISKLSKQIKRIYRLRKKALTRYYKGKGTVKEIADAIGISKTEIYRLAKKARAKNRYGEITGWCACIPYYRPIAKYNRASNSTRGMAGAFTKFLRDNNFEEQLTKLALGQTLVNGRPVRGKELEDIEHAFRKICVDAGIDVNDHYPFNNQDGGKEALRNYVNRVRSKNFVASVRVEYGSKIAGMAASAGKGHNNSPSPLRPYDRVQLDEHLIHSIPVLLTTNSQGEEVAVPNARVWVIIAIDERSRAVLGHSISETQNFSAEDIVTCFANVFEPWEKVLHPNPTPPYIPNSGFPSGLFKECQWRIFNRIQIDNAFSHLAHWVWDRLAHVGVGEICLNHPGAPRENPLIERLNETFEKKSFHRLPNTTGSNPQDPRRAKYPERKAAKLGITIEHIEQITDFTLANYNATPHSSLDGKTPLEVIKAYIDKGDHPIRQHHGRSLQSLEIFDEDLARTIRASKKDGHPPYVKYLKGRYSSLALKERGDLINKEVYLRINRKDIRFGTIYETDGTRVCDVTVEKRWAWVSHTAADRRRIQGLINEGYIKAAAYNPIGEYYEFLKEQSKTSKHYRNKLHAFEKSSGLSEEIPTDEAEQEDTQTKNKNKPDTDDPDLFSDIDFEV